MIWEDMCYKSGPLISPEFYSTFMSPYLKEVVATAKSCGIKGIVVDNDGDCSKMLPLYLECGVNAFYPFEVQAGMDIINIRKQYGNAFTIIGGLDKRALAVGEDAIRKELDGKVPFMSEIGGYIPMLDHSVPTDVSLKSFRFYLDYVRSLGKAK
jgi:uroporphyrinogen decarboxylase